LPYRNTRLHEEALRSANSRDIKNEVISRNYNATEKTFYFQLKSIKALSSEHQPSMWSNKGPLFVF